MNDDVIAVSGSLAITDETLRAFAKGRLDEATEQQILALLETRPDLAAQVAAISSDAVLEKLRSSKRNALNQSLSSQLESKESQALESPNTQSAQTPKTPPELSELTDFKILKEIGRGGMGVVYLAEHLLTGRKEVLKVLNERLMTNREARKRFDQEIKCIASMNHETIVRCYTVKQLSSSLVLCMEYVSGTNLHQFINNNGPLPIHVACGIAAEVCKGLQHAMDNGLVHRDIKPSNIMLYKSDGKIKAKILDFGLARLQSRDNAKGLTNDGTLLGTLEYISPEQCLNAASADIRSDIYSLGCTLYHMLVGHPPFSGSSGELVLAHSQAIPPALNLIRPEVPSQLAGLVSKLLAKQPDRRYPSPRAVISDLQPFVQRHNKPKVHPPASLTTPVTTKPRSVNKAAETLSSEAVGKGDTSVELVKPLPDNVTSPKSPEPLQANHLPASLPDADSLNSTATHQSAAVRRISNTTWVASAVAIICLASLLFYGTLMVRTKQATIAFEGLPENAKVEVDGEVVTLNWEDRHATINVLPGSRQVQVEVDGTTVIGETVKLGTRETKTISITTEESKQLAIISDVNDTKQGNSDSAAIASLTPLLRPQPATVPFSQENAARLQADWAKFLGVPDVFTDKRGITFRLIPPGEFTMGSTQSEINQTITLLHASEESAKFIRSEAPQRIVAITEPFYLATEELTQLQFLSVSSYNPSRYTAQGTDAQQLTGINTMQLPVERVSHDEAIDFCSRINRYYQLCSPSVVPSYDHRLTGYRLPSEAEWEFACRAGSNEWFWSGDSPNTITRFENTNGTIGIPKEVGKTTANPFGLFDMSGNVREHVADYFESNQSGETKLVIDPLVQPNKDRTYSIVKGGDYYFTPMIGRPASRYATLADTPSQYTTGFRVAMSIDTYRQLEKWKPPLGIERFDTLYGATKSQFDAWLKSLGQDMIPISINLRQGTSEHLHDAVAVNNNKSNKWRFNELADDREAGADYKQFRGGYQAHWKLIYPTAGRLPMQCPNAVLWRLQGLDGWATWNIGRSAPRPALDGYARGGQIPVSICVVNSGDTHNTHVKVVSRPGIGNRAIARLTLEQLGEQVEQCKREGWRPSILQAHAGSQQPFYAAVFRENSNGFSWDYSSDLTVNQFEQELEKRKKMGFYPAGLASYMSDGEPKYVVIWSELAISPIP